MLDYISNMPPFLQALIAGVITWLLTALGAATVFVFKSVNEKVLNSMQGFARWYYDRRKFLVITPTGH